MGKNVLAEIYFSIKEKPTPASTFVKELAKVTHRSETSVRKWIAGDIIPDINTQILIAEHLGVEVKTLFNQTGS